MFIRNSGVTCLLASAVLTAGLCVTAADAQSGRRGTMVIDDGEIRRVLHFSEPDLQRILQPDIDMHDLPLFEEHLNLSQPQIEAAKRAIEDYLSQFQQLVQDRHPGSSPFSEPARAGGDEQEGDGEQAPASAEPNPIRDILRDEMRKAGIDPDALAVQPEVGVDVQLGGDDESESTAPPKPDVNVSVSFGTEDDSLSDEMRAKLSEVAEKAAARITEHVEKDVAEQMAGGEMGAPAGSPDEEIDAKWVEIQALRGRVDAFVEAKRDLRTKLMDQIMAVLSEPQVERWPALDRALTRKKTLSFAVLDGEGADLTAIVYARELPGSEMRAINELLVAYEINLHEALRRRNALLDEIDAQIDQALYDGKASAAVSAVDRMTAARTTVRGINEQFIEAIAGELGEESAQEFREAAMKACFPRIYRTTVGERAFTAVAELEGLDAPTRASIDALRTAYLAELSQVNDRIRLGVRQLQTDEQRAWIQRLVAVLEGATDSAHGQGDTVAAQFAARQQLNVRYMTSLYEMLPPNMIADLPPIPTIGVSEPVTAKRSR